MTASVAIQVLPDVKDTDELIRIVDKVIDYIASTGYNYYVGPFETTIEGDSYDELMEIVKNCQKVAIEAGCPSVSAYVKICYKPEGGVLTIDKKVSKHHKYAGARNLSFRFCDSLALSFRGRFCSEIYASLPC